ncbi:MAG: GNAT family N-acetyltransferase [Crocinitomicaceae bacterium]|nr:GNAT family N-acetyltransferase [Crocinitomicaceae bacterium]
MNKPSVKYYNQESERLIFRAIKMDDAVRWSSFFINNPTQKYVGTDQLRIPPLEKAQKWLGMQIKRQKNKTYGQLAVIDKNTNRFIGVGGIIERNIKQSKEYEITYSLLPSSWGKGFATELALHFKKYAFENIKTNSVISMIHKENKASINVAIKNGMSQSDEINFMEMDLFIYSVNS